MDGEIVVVVNRVVIAENAVGSGRWKGKQPRRTEREEVAVTVDGGIYEQCVSACIRS